MSKPIKAIVCGAGDMARKHIEACRKLDSVEISAVASRSIPRAAALSAAYDIPRYYDDIDDAFGREQADIVSVCVPTAHHPAITTQAMAKGLHVITEKPIALTVAAAQEMIAAAEKYRRKLTVVFNRRFNTVWQELTQRLSSIGIPLVYNTQEIRSIRAKPAMHSQSANGGPVIDCCVHDLKENGHETIIRKFVESVELNSEVPVQPQEAIEALKISLAALKSIDSGKKETV